MFDKNNDFVTAITASNCRELVHKTVNKVCDIVGSSLGPSGRLTLIRKPNNVLSLTKDGVSIAKSIKDLSSFEESIIARILLEASEKTAYNAGDATTSTLVLAQSIYNQVYNLPGYHNYNEIKRGMDFAVNGILKDVGIHAKSISTFEEIRSVASISANGDDQVANLVAEAYYKLGSSALVYIKESDLQTTSSIAYLEGFTVDRGWESIKFVTDEAEEKCVLENPLVILTEEKLTSIFDIEGILSAAHAKKRSVMILARDYEKQVISDLVSYKMRGLKVCAAKSPDFGDQRKRTLEDIAVVLGGTVVSLENGVNFGGLTLQSLGECELVEVYRNTATFSGGKGEQSKIDERVLLIEMQMNSKDVDDLYTKHKYVERLSRLKGVIATIVVGANTESERGELKDRFEDSIFACKVALSKGVVPGGGSVFAKLSDMYKLENSYSEDFIHGFNIIQRSLLAPLTKLLVNAGYDKVGVELVIHDVVISAPEFGLNVLTGKMVNLFDEGIIEPVAVLEESLKNAASVAASLILTDNIIF